MPQADFVRAPTLKLWRKSPKPAMAGEGGDDVPKFEPKKWLKFKDLDKSIRDLRRIYKENPAYFDIPTFARKVY